MKKDWHHYPLKTGIVETRRRLTKGGKKGRILDRESRPLYLII